MSDNYNPYIYPIGKIKVIGVGSGGINAVAGMISKIEGVELWAIDTDVSNSIDRTPILNALTLRDKSEWESKIATALKGAELVFLVAGMGGENGLEAMMEVARVSKQIIGALTVGVVTRSCIHEGTERCTRATNGIEKLVTQVDTLVTIPNNKLLIKSENLISNQAIFVRADNIIRSAVQCISDAILIPGMINVDLTDVRSVLADAGLAYFGIGKAEGTSRGWDAALQAINSPLLEGSIDHARGVILTITAGLDTNVYILAELTSVADTVYDSVCPSANIIVGALVDDSMEAKMEVSMIVTGIDDCDWFRRIWQPNRMIDYPSHLL